MGSLSRYTSRQAIAYYALSAPAVVSEVTFSQALASNPQAIIPPIAALGAIILEAVQILPWIILAFSIYAVLSSRPSALVTLLTISFFVLTMTVGRVDSYNAALVVASSFSALVGFRYARAAKVLGGRELKLESHGPVWTRFAGLAIDMGFPLAGALALMALVAAVIASIETQAQLLPEPVATLSRLYFSSHLYLVSTIIAVAGMAVWAMRQLIEPMVMMFTLTRQDAVDEAWRQVGDVVLKIEKERRYQPGRGRGWVVASIAVALLTIAYVGISGGPSRAISTLLSVFGAAGITSSPWERTVEGVAENMVRQANAAVSLIEGLVNFIIRLLWG